MPRARESRARTFDVWPGFVDALTQLLMVIIFVVLVFTVSQFYLGFTLEGRDAALTRLNRQVAEIADLLALERQANSDLRSDVSRLTSALDTANRSRESLAGQLTALLTERDALEESLGRRTAERDDLVRSLTGTRVEADNAASRLAIAEAARAQLDAALALANRTVTADRETIETQLRDLARLARDLDALRTVRTELERQVANLSTTLSQTAERAAGLEESVAAGQAALADADRRYARLSERAAGAEEAYVNTRAELAESDRQRAAAERRAAGLEETVTAGRAALAESERGRTAAAGTAAERAKTIDELRAELARLDRQARELASAVAERDARIRALTATVGERDAALAERATAARAQEQAAGALRDRTKELEARLANERERTLLAQRTIENDAVRLRALLERAETADKTLAEEQRVHGQAKGTIQALLGQVDDLKRELEKLNAALEASEIKAKAQNVQIVDLGSRLNQALASRVQELTRYRSEFFGRLRTLLGDRPDIEIVGDRFVFPAEVLFPVGSPELEESGKERIARLAKSLKEIAATIPSELNWILRVDGHTDRTTVRSQFYKSNWELSQARALTVVRFLIEQGIPPDRLAATGFGEFQPLDRANNEAAYAKNRRIEIKLTER